MYFVEFPQVQYIDLSEIVHGLKAAVMVTIDGDYYQRCLWTVTF